MKKKSNLWILSLLVLGMFTMFISSCSKDEDEALSELTTENITDITSATAKSGGAISSDGGFSITQKGVCWSESQNPTISDSKTEDGTGTGSFTSDIIDLDDNTMYYVRSYATTSNGTGYGNQVSFTSSAQSPKHFTATIDGVAYNATSLQVLNLSGTLTINGKIGTRSLIVWLPEDFTTGSHSAELLGDYMVQYSPTPGVIYTSESGTINITEYNSVTGKIVANFNCIAQGSGADITITNGSFVAYK